MCGPMGACDPRVEDEPLQPLIIQILIGAEVKFQDDDQDRIEELKEEIQKEISKHLHKFTGAGYNRESMWPYLDKVDHEVTFSDEGRFEYVEGPEEE